MIKSMGIVAINLVALPNLFSIVLSTVGTIYFLSMIKLNIVDKKYGGSWKEFIKCWFKKRMDKNSDCDKDIDK